MKSTCKPILNPNSPLESDLAPEKKKWKSQKIKARERESLEVLDGKNRHPYKENKRKIRGVYLFI